MNFFKVKYRGSVLAFTVYILICITILISMIFMHSGIVLHNASILLKKELMHQDLENAIEYLLYDIDLNYEFDEIIQSESSVIVPINFSWGFIEV